MRYSVNIFISCALPWYFCAMKTEKRETVTLKMPPVVMASIRHSVKNGWYKSQSHALEDAWYTMHPEYQLPIPGTYAKAGRKPKAG